MFALQEFTYNAALVDSPGLRYERHGAMVARWWPARSEGICALCSHCINIIIPSKHFSLEQATNHPLCLKISEPQGKGERSGAKSS